MGKLTPGITLIYESPDKGETVYAREAGTDKKTLVGYNFPRDKSVQLTHAKLWADIHEAALTNAELQNLLQMCIIVYNTIKSPVLHHPV